MTVTIISFDFAGKRPPVTRDPAAPSVVIILPVVRVEAGREQPKRRRRLARKLPKEIA